MVANKYYSIQTEINQYWIVFNNVKLEKMRNSKGWKTGLHFPEGIAKIQKYTPKTRKIKTFFVLFSAMGSSAATIIFIFPPHPFQYVVKR